MAGRTTADRWCQAAQEGLLLILLASAPWAFAGAEPQDHAALLGGVAVLTLLAGIRLMLSSGPAWRGCIFTALLGALFLFTALQLIPLPPAVLRVVSPRSLEFYTDLLPSEPEVLSGEVEPLGAARTEWHPISLYPFATRSLLVDLLALFLVVAIVRGQLTTPASLRRLGWVALINGSALSVFALSQSLSARPTMVYWSIPTQGTVFGPFINRDHFPFYVGLCIGLSAGLLSRRRSAGLGSILQDSRQLWVAAGVGLMLVACAFSLSRGAALAMAGATLIVGSMAWLTRAGRPSRAGGLILAAGVALVITLWLGSVPLESRLASLGQKAQLWQGRLDMWRVVLPHLRDFPIVGSGGGTFEFLEPMYQQRPRQGELFITQYAHNEYLEAMFEGGVPRLLLTLALAVAPCCLVWRRLRAARGDGARGPILGMLWGLVVVALHSAIDFGIHMPAVALLTAVTAAHVSAVTSRYELAPDNRPAARWTVAAVAVALGLLLAWEAATWALSEQYRKVATALTRSPRFEDREKARPYWEAAVQLRPRDAVLHQSAGQASLDLYRGGRADSLATAVRQLVAARDACPVLAHPHARLGELSGAVARADTPVRYFERAARLLPSETEIWYGLGGAYLDAGQTEEAAAAWRRYLESGERFRPQLLDRAAARWSADAIRDKLLPDRPEVWIAAAHQLYPKKEQGEQRRPFLEGAVALMEREPPSAESSYRRATVERELRLDDAAEASYRVALRDAPGRVDWRFEFAEYLNRRQKFEQARAELRMILDRAPDHDGAKNLLAIVERELQLRDR
jgi:O-antigen ligase